MIRSLFILLMLAGGVLGIGYPRVVGNLADTDIGKWRVYDRSSGFTSVGAALAPSQAPVLATVELVTRGPLPRGDGEPVLTVTVDAQGRTVLAETLDFEDVEATLVNPQAGEQLYRIVLPKIDPVDSGPYLFTLGPGTVAQEQLLSADLILRTRAFDVDPRAIPAGYVLMAIGLVGFIASFRGRQPKNPNSSPPPPRWGRG